MFLLPIQLIIVVNALITVFGITLSDNFHRIACCPAN